MTWFIQGAFARQGCPNCHNPNCTGNCDPCTATPLQSDGMIYSGPNLPCTGIRTCDSITDAILKIDEIICQILNRMTTTTTTTTMCPECVDQGIAVFV